MNRSIAWIRDVVPFTNDAQTDRSQAVIAPKTDGTDPFLFLIEDWFSTKGFDWHPHRGFETVTYVVDGTLEHRNNAGGHGILKAGDLQWTTTGSGVLHTEIAHQHKGVHTLQLWLNLPSHKKMSPPRYQDLRGSTVPFVETVGARARVFAGTQHGTTGPAKLHHPAGIVDLQMDAEGTYPLQIPNDHFAFVYVLHGEVGIGPSTVKTGQVLGSLPGGTEMAIEAKQASHVLAYHGLPIGEPVAQHGPFVMNTHEEIVQAVRDYQSGAFGQIPS